ncbi:MAG: C25 family cysteine peptidase [Candidatus Cloacimonetes bacterium]|nr:C25 family cysteine peptidase [Candidatus Cloacimonadota bacterium]MCK9177656.1 C25 family cysteine peptidase [Candidatus Cloacimonadota bacterium]MDD3533103.1 C25 family cysteine peptidase [Candidatus Cloacimonadota bacterium]
MKQLILVCVLLSVLTLVFAESPVRIQQSRAESLTLRFTAPELELSSQKVGSQDFTAIKMASASTSPEPGLPELPVFSTSIIMPASGSYTLNVQPLSQRKLQDIHPLPVFEEGSKAEFEPSKYYSAQTQPVVQSSGISVLRDFRILSLSIHPVQWDAKSSELTVYDEVLVEVSFTDEASVTDMADYVSYSPAFRNIYAANLLNFEDYRYLNSTQGYGRILMIRANNSNSVYLSLIENFANWKRMKGHEVNLVNVQIAGSSSTAIKNYIQAQYDNPDTRPDYVILIGDTPQIPTFYESYTYYNGEGDYPYTFLAGDDLLGDVFIGRISVETVDQLATVLSKVYRYERDIVNDPSAAAWVNRILLIGDPSTSGISCMYNSKYIKELAESVNPDYSFIENYSGGYASTINSGINQGVNFFSYRGYINMSGWSPSSSLMNNPRFPHAVILTCSTGNFASSYGAATSESFIRLGTSANPSGAVTAIAMATTGTHTMYNNALNASIFNGIFAHGMRSMGEALLNGRLFLYQTYGTTHSSDANASAHWCNLMGDPSMEVFVGIPGNLQIEAPDSLAFGSTMLDIRVLDDGYIGLADASVTAFNQASSQIVARGYTDAEGYVSLFIGSGMQGDIIITAAIPDKKPASRTVYAADGGIVYYDKILYDNGEHGSSGNSDSFAQAGETIALMLTVKNTTATALTGISASVSCDDEYIQLQTSTISCGDIPAFGHLMANEPVLMTLSHDIPAQHDVRLEFEFSDASGGNHLFPMHLSAYNASLEVETVNILAGGNEILDPSETGTVQLGIRNRSVATVHDVSAQLFSLNDLVQVQTDQAYVGSIVAGSMTYTLEDFEVFARTLLIPGMQIPFRVHLSNDSGFEQDAFFNISIGNVTQNTPLGPDSYGYFIYDESDTYYQDCPTYDWIEINPALGGGGTLLDTLYDPGTPNDEGDQNGSTTLEVVDLPFSFNFYGVAYDQITVCVNGFIAMGITENAEFRNCRIPSGHGPAPMIAPFWDDLIIIGDAGIYQYYDAENHKFIIEYYKLRNGYNRTSLETFQVIFYDPLYHHTSLGDGKIKIQYQDFNNVDIGGGGYSLYHGKYATIGIKDHTNTRGLEYSYNNQYPTAAAPLSNNSALMISTVPVLHESPYLVLQELIVNDPSGNGKVEPGETVELGIRLINQGINTAQDAQITVSLDHPHAQLSNSQSTYPDIPGDMGAVNIQPIGLIVSEDCPDGSQLQLSVHVQTDSAEWIYPTVVLVHKPSIEISSYYMHDAQGNANGLVDPGESFDLVVNFSNTSDVDAYNLTANIMSMSEHVTILNPGVLLRKVPANGLTQAKYEISISPEAPLGNNLSFYLTFLGELVPATNNHLLISIGTTGMSQDFESDDGNFEPVPASNAWEWGSSSAVPAHSGDKLWGTRLNASYGANANYKLSTPSIYIGNDFGLEFWHYFDTEANYDGGNVQISTDSGNSWQVLHPEGGYTNSHLNSLNGPGFSGSSNGWIRSSFSLSAYGNQNVKFRFSFASDSNTQAQGWFIDDVRTSGYMEYAGKISGQILSSDPDIDFESIFISSAEGISAIADQNGDFELYLPMGTGYVSAAAEGYYSTDPVAIELSFESPGAVLDFYLGYLKPVSNADYYVNDGLLDLSWDAPDDPEYPLLGYEVYRRFGAAAFEMVEATQQPLYQETLELYGEYQYYILAIYAEGKSQATLTLSFYWGGVDNPDQPLPPAVTGLERNYPNPFNPSTTICFTLSEASAVRLSIYNLKGQRVASLMDEVLSSGAHRKIWNALDERGRSVSSGIYLIRLETNSGTFTQKAMLMK